MPKPIRSNTTSIFAQQRQMEWRWPSNVPPLPRSSSAGRGPRRSTAGNNYSHHQNNTSNGRGRSPSPSPLEIPMPADRASLNSLIDLDESLFGITDDSTNKHISPEYPSTPPRSANGTAAPWSSAGMFFGEEGLSMSPFDGTAIPPTLPHNIMDYTPPIPETSPPPANFLLSPPDEEDEDLDFQGGSGGRGRGRGRS
ncbi:uncharacterized protein PG986_010574 [Apiospora aurea]|uniref:Uncharacterized protein n=1 Tax=Apiospora aurea TaxID=335848 RepID=A0ABR1Q3W0_9PEZI